MKRNLSILLFALMVIGLSLTSCRNRELCPAYTDGEPLVEEAVQEVA